MPGPFFGTITNPDRCHGVSLSGWDRPVDTALPMAVDTGTLLGTVVSMPGGTVDRQVDTRVATALPMTMAKGGQSLNLLSSVQ